MSTTGWVLTGSVLLLSAPSLAEAPHHARGRAAPASFTQPASRAHGMPATIAFVTARGAYLKRGAKDGLALGMVLPWARRTGASGSCRIVELADHFSSCAREGGVRVGDSVTLPPAPRRPAPVVLPPVPTEAQLARQRSSLEAVPFKQIGFKPSTLARAVRSAHPDVRLSEDFWQVRLPTASTFAEQRVDVSFHGAELPGGLRASMDVEVLQWIARPQTYRFPYAGTAAFFVYELEVSRRQEGSWPTFSAGRIWAYRTPGLGVVDGAQVGAKFGSFELGVVGGWLPDAITTAVGTARPLAGLYLTGSHTSEGPWRWVEGSLSLLALTSPNGAGHYAADALGQATLGDWLDTDGEVRVGTGGDTVDHYLELARIDLHAHPADKVQLMGSVRYISAPYDEIVQVGTYPGFFTRSFTASAQASYSSGTLSWAANAGYAYDFPNDLGRAFGGPEIGFPRLFGPSGGISVGAQGSLGWLQGFGGYTDIVLIPSAIVTLRSRLAFDHWTTAHQNEPSASVMADVRLSRYLTARASVAGNVGLTPTTGSSLPQPFGIMASASVGGQF